MAQVLVRELEPEVVERLRARARVNGRSLEAELRAVLRREAGVSVAEERARYEVVPKPSPAIRPPARPGPMPPIKRVRVRGKPVSRQIIEDRR